MCKMKNKENKDEIKYNPSIKRLKARQRNNSLTDGFMGEWVGISAMPRK